MSNLDGYENQLDESPPLEDIPQIATLLALQTASKLVISELVKDGSPMRAVMEEIKRQADITVDDFIYADLYTSEGLKKAQGFQSKIHRHIDLMDALTSVIARGDEAVNVIKNASIDQGYDEANPNEDIND